MARVRYRTKIILSDRTSSERKHGKTGGRQGLTPCMDNFVLSWAPPLNHRSAVEASKSPRSRGESRDAALHTIMNDHLGSYLSSRRRIRAQLSGVIWRGRKEGTPSILAEQ